MRILITRTKCTKMRAAIISRYDEALVASAQDKIPPTEKMRVYLKKIDKQVH